MEYFVYVHNAGHFPDRKRVQERILDRAGRPATFLAPVIAARELGSTVQHIGALIRMRALEPHTIGGLIYVSKDAVDDLQRLWETAREFRHE